jgi:hypothetical protein
MADWTRAFADKYNLDFEGTERIIDLQVAVIGRSEVSNKSDRLRYAKTPWPSAVAQT